MSLKVARLVQYMIFSPYISYIDKFASSASNVMIRHSGEKNRLL